MLGLDKEKAYFDCTGAPLPSKSLLKHYCDELISKGHEYGNPHSGNEMSMNTMELIEDMRRRVLDFVDADENDYAVVFTGNATAGCRLVAENFCWYPETSLWMFGWIWTLLMRFIRIVLSPAHLILLNDNHTSAVGIRACASGKHARIRTINPDSVDRWLSSLHFNIPIPLATNSLFVYPAQSNFNGQNYPLKWVKQVQQLSSNNRQWYVLLDAASYCSNSRLSLTETPADFVTLSFYKIFGFPTGIGALIIRKSSASALKKSYFGGGTVAAIASSSNWHVLLNHQNELSNLWEDGTVNYHGLIGLKCAFDIYDRNRQEDAHQHQKRLWKMAITLLRRLKHGNGRPMIKLYMHDENSKDYGPIVNFNIINGDGSFVSCGDFNTIASECGIIVRSGSFCNPGALNQNLGITEKMLKQRYYVHKKSCRDDFPPYESGQPSGSIRISFGSYNTEEQIYKLVNLIVTYFRNEIPAREICCLHNEKHVGTLVKISVFPIKSCGAFTPTEWLVTKSGVFLDRQWKLESIEYGKTLTQKKCPRLALIAPVINLENNSVDLTAPGQVPISFEIETSLCEYPFVVNKWFSEFTGIPCKLVRCDKPGNSFTNSSAYLAVNMKSFESLGKNKLQNSISSFRGNLEMSLERPFVENEAETIKIGKSLFKCEQKCERCTMINVNQSTGERNGNMFLELYKTSSCNNVYFGRYLSLISRDNLLKIGDCVEIL